MVSNKPHNKHQQKVQLTANQRLSQIFEIGSNKNLISISLLSILILALALVLSGCSALNGPQACVEDKFCSFDEKLSGNCADCNPDFAVDDTSWSANYNDYDRSIDAFVCVKNKQGEYTDKVQLGWALSSKSDYRGDYNDEYVYFDAPDVQGNFEINAGKGTIWQSSNLQFANAQDQVQCFSHRFENLEQSRYYYVNFQINGDGAVAESNLDNNYAWKYLEGTAESYPEYLIEETINGRFVYTHSNYGVEYLQLSDDREISLEIYSAEYDNDYANSYASVAVIPTADPKQLLNTLIDETSILDGFSKASFGENKLVFISPTSEYEESYMWTSGSYLMYSRVSGNDANKRDVVVAYLKRYASDLVNADGPMYVNPSYFTLNVPQKVIIDNVEYTVEITGGSSDSESIILQVNNVSKTVSERNEYMTINGLDVYAVDIYITNIPEPSAAATLKFAKANSDNDVETTPSCFDSDGGLNYTVSGNASVSSGGESIDRCEGDNVIEAYCVNSTGPTSSVSYACSNGCSNGACLSLIKTTNSTNVKQVISTTPNKLVESAVGDFTYGYKTESTDAVWLGNDIVNRTQYMAVYMTAVTDAFAIVRVADYFSKSASISAINSWYLGTTDAKNVTVNGSTVLRYVAPYDNNRDATNYLWKSGSHVIYVQGPSTEPQALVETYLALYPVN